MVKEAILFDAQFSTKDGQKIVDLIKKRKRELKQIVITPGDPDYYFGLEPIVKAFPNINVMATPDAKLALWKPKLRDSAPKKIIVPKVTTEKMLTLDGERIEWRSPNACAVYLSIPASKVIFGGVGIDSGIHLFTADTQTRVSRQAWMNTLQEMEELNAKTVIPGHYMGIWVIDQERIMPFSLRLTIYKILKKRYRIIKMRPVLFAPWKRNTQNWRNEAPLS